MHSILIPNKSAIFLTFSLLNSLPLSDNSFCGVPNKETQCLKNKVTTLSALLLFITAPAQKRVATSTITKKYNPCHILRSIATVSLNLVASGNETTGFGKGFLNLMHVSHSELILSTALEYCIFNFLAFLSNSLSFKAEGCANCRCNFLTTFSTLPL